LSKSAQGPNLSDRYFVICYADGMKKTSDRVNIIGILILGALLIGGLFWWQKSQDSPSTPASVTEPTQPQPATTGIILRSTSDEELSPLQPIDQPQFAQAIQAAWEEALSKAPQNVAKFPNDANLIALQVPTNDPLAPQTLVVYANKPIIVETNPVESLANDQPYELAIDRENYQLLIKFSYTPPVTALDLHQVLTEAFNQILNHRRLPVDQENSPYKILAFEALL